MARTRRALLAVFLAGPLAAVGVCASVAPLAAPPAVCAAPAEAGDCCSRSGAPGSPRTPAPDRCAVCGAAACALGETRATSRLARESAAWAVAARPGVAPRLARRAAARMLSFLAASPPRHVLLSTFRN